jgi:hypothetical protein
MSLSGIATAHTLAGSLLQKFDHVVTQAKEYWLLVSPNMTFRHARHIIAGSVNTCESSGILARAHLINVGGAPVPVVTYTRMSSCQRLEWDGSTTSQGELTSYIQAHSSSNSNWMLVEVHSDSGHTKRLQGGVYASGMGAALTIFARRNWLWLAAILLVLVVLLLSGLGVGWVW